MPTAKRHRFTMEDVLAEAPARRNLAVSGNRDITVLHQSAVADERVPITARIRSDVRERLGRAVLEVQLHGCRGVSLKDVLEVALAPLLDDLDARGSESELVRRLKGGGEG